jgi:hypothetical protein
MNNKKIATPTSIPGPQVTNDLDDVTSRSRPMNLQQPTVHPETSHGPGAGIYIAFVPWVLFTLVTQHYSLTAAAVVALAAAVAISISSIAKGRPKLLELSAVVAFAGFTAVALAVDPATGEWVARYARAIAAGGLALTAFGSLLFVPFTEQYARETVPAQYWGTSAFKHVNRQLTAMWGWVFVTMIPCHLIAGAVDTQRVNTIFNWVIPILLVMWAAKRTAALTAHTNEAEARRDAS